MLRGDIYRLMADYLSFINGRESISHAYKELRKVQHNSVEEIQQITIKKTKYLMEHAVHNVSYYKSIFDEEKISLNNIKTLKDLDKVPILTKRDIRNHFPKEITDSKLLKRGFYNTTSGSTGDPLEFYMDHNTNPYSISSIMYFNTVMGVKEFDVHWNLKSMGEYSAKDKLMYWLLGKHMYSVLEVKKEKLPIIMNQINSIRPSYFECYSASLEKLARFMYEENLKLKHRPKAIIATSEMLTEAGRELSEQVFESEVFDRYGFREFSAAVAQECKEHNGLHISPLLTHVEIVDQNGENVDEGEEGRIVITDLNNMVMPFIRYETGDFGVKGGSDCPCGLPFSLIKSVKGRIGEFLIARNGDKIPFVTISAIMFRKYFTPYVYTYQFNQKEKGVISVKIVPTKKYSQEIHRQMEEALGDALPGFETEVIVVDDIQPESSGKTPFLKKMTTT